MTQHGKIVSPFLVEILKKMMDDPLFTPFRLVGGTNLALRFHHRESTDIDLFTDELYGSLNFNNYYHWFLSRFNYCQPSDKSSKVGMGKTYYVGDNEENAIKIDLMYEGEKFLYQIEQISEIRMADVKEIGVMKLDAIYYGGRKKDFWDLHFLLVDQDLSLDELILLHKKRFPYQHEREEMLYRLKDFAQADDEPDPKCMLGKKWDIIKLDILDFCNLIE